MPRCDTLAARPLIVLDFDGTVVDKGAEEIDPEVAAAVRRVAERWAVMIVTSRGSDRAVAEARRALTKAGLGRIPLLHRDRRRHDNSPTGLVASKCQLIERSTRGGQLRPALGIGDRETDVLAYERLGMIVIGLQRDVGERLSGADRVVAVGASIAEAWVALPEQIHEALGAEA